MNRTPAFALIMAAALGGCAVLSNVTPIGDGTFMAVVHSNDVDAPVDEEKARATAQAEGFCRERGGRVETIRLVAPPPPPGQPPSAEIDFRCAS